MTCAESLFCIVVPLGLTVGGFVMSVFTYAGCRFFIRLCFPAGYTPNDVGNVTTIACPVSGAGASYLGDGYRFGLYLYEESFNGNQCEAYPPTFALADTKFAAAQGFVVASMLLGGIAVLSLLTKCCLVSGSGRRSCVDGTALLATALAQGLTFLVFRSGVCTDVLPDGVVPQCYMDSTGYYSVASATSYFAAAVICYYVMTLNFVTTPLLCKS